MHRRLAIAALVLMAGAAIVFFFTDRRGESAPADDDNVAVETATAVAAHGQRLQDEIAALAPQRPGHPDLFVLGVAGDGSEQVFLNEVRHLRDVAERRLDARGHVLVLANHPAEPPFRLPVPATPLTVRKALLGLGAAMDPAEDILLLYVTTHGSPDHWLLLRRDDLRDRRLDAHALRAALDDAGIRHRVLVLSACYSGGLAPDLQTPDTLLLAAARDDRTSFGCGNDSVATYFGRAWLVNGLNATVDFVEAFRQARKAISAREREEDYEPSLPQIRRGERIGAHLAAWRAGFQPGPPVPYPHVEPVFEEEWLDEEEEEIVPPWLPPAVLAAREAAAEAHGGKEGASPKDDVDGPTASERPAGDKSSKP